MSVADSCEFELILEIAIIGLAVPLYNAFIPYYLSTRGAAYGDGSVYLTYRNNVIIGLVALPAAPFGGWAVELPRVGRKGTLSVFTSMFTTTIKHILTWPIWNSIIGRVPFTKYHSSNV